MNRCNFTASMLLCLVSFVANNNSVHAQAGVGYAMHEIPYVKTEGIRIVTNGMNDLGMVIGSHYPGGVRTGFIYDHYGMIGAPRTMHNLTEWIDIPAGWTASSCVGINEMGQVVGMFERTVIVNGGSQTERVGFLLDLDMYSEIPMPDWDYLPVPPGAISSYGRRINNLGLVVIETQSPSLAEYLWDSNSDGDQLIQIVNPATNQVVMPRVMAINDSGQIVGGSTAYNPNGGYGYLLTPGVGLVWGPSKAHLFDLNQYGQVCGERWFTNNKGATTLTNAIRFTATNGLETLSTLESRVWRINDSGDAAGGFNKRSIQSHRPALFHNEWGWIYLEGTRMSGSASDLSIWGNAATYRDLLDMTNRTAIGLPNLTATASLTTTTGKGKNVVTTRVEKLYFLEPRILP